MFLTYKTMRKIASSRSGPNLW